MIKWSADIIFYAVAFIIFLLRFDLILCRGVFRKASYFITLKKPIALFDSKTGLRSKTEKCGWTLQSRQIMICFLYEIRIFLEPGNQVFGGFLLWHQEEKVFTQGKTIVYRRGARGGKQRIRFVLLKYKELYGGENGKVKRKFWCV